MQRIVGGAALNQTPFLWEGNFENIVGAIREARAQGVQLLCLPELCITGYGCEDVFLSEWLPEKALLELMRVVPHTKGIAVCVGLPLLVEGRLYNCAAMLEDGKVKGIYAKQHLANDGVHYEKRWFTAWPAHEERFFGLPNGEVVPFGDVIIEAAGLRVGFEICEDAWVGASRPGYNHTKRGIDVVLNPSASHFAFGKTHIREKIVVDGSREFDCIYVYANLLGNESGKMIFDGEIMIAQKGRMVQQNDRLSFKDVNVASVLIDVQAPQNTPVLDLAPYASDKETEFHEAVSLGMFDYVRKSRSRGFVLSLSGGADSCACAVMVATMVQRGVDELGLEEFNRKLNHLYTPDEVDLAKTLAGKELHRFLMKKMLTTAYQGTVNSSTATLESARELAEYLGATFYHWTIDAEVQGYTQKVEAALGRTLTWERDDITLQNIQARVRAPIIWMFANEKNALLLATSNRSEADVGYATMDGDTAGSISPISGVDKSFVRSYLLYAEKVLGYEALGFVNALAPTAELRPLSQTQTDEKDLMPYPLLRDIERLAVKERLAPKAVFEALAKAQNAETDNERALLKGYVKKFFLLWSRNQWKRERYAPGFHLDDFSVDPRSWCRFPILNGGYAQELAEL